MKPNAIEMAETDIQETLKLTAGKDFPTNRRPLATDDNFIKEAEAKNGSEEEESPEVKNLSSLKKIKNTYLIL